MDKLSKSIAVKVEGREDLEEMRDLVREIKEEAQEAVGLLEKAQRIINALSQSRSES